MVRECTCVLELGHAQRQPEIAENAFARLAHQDVGRFEIAMDDRLFYLQRCKQIRCETVVPGPLSCYFPQFRNGDTEDHLKFLGRSEDRWRCRARYVPSELEENPDSTRSPASTPMSPSNGSSFIRNQKQNTPSPDNIFGT